MFTPSAAVVDRADINHSSGYWHDWHNWHNCRPYHLTWAVIKTVQSVKFGVHDLAWFCYHCPIVLAQQCRSLWAIKLADGESSATSETSDDAESVCRICWLQVLLHKFRYLHAWDRTSTMSQCTYISSNLGASLFRKCYIEAVPFSKWALNVLYLLSMSFTSPVTFQWYLRTQGTNVGSPGSIGRIGEIITTTVQSNENTQITLERVD